MRVFTSSEIKFLENSAIETGKTYSELMNTAGTAVAHFVNSKIDINKKRVVVLCGKGNNGGDGFICAEELSKKGAIVSVILASSTIKTKLAHDAFNSMSDKINILRDNIESLFCESLIDTADVIVDAIFGISFSGSVSGNEEKLIKIANRSKALKIAVDIPSGAFCDNGKIDDTCFNADYTITFIAVKPAHVIQPAMDKCGKVEICDIGIDNNLMSFLPQSIIAIDDNLVKNCFKPRNSDSHKGTYGRLLMICGSYGMIGAAILCAKAALRSGVGLLDIVVSSECYPIIATAIPEAIFTIIDFSSEEATKNSSNKLFESIKKANAFVIGCGLGEESSRYIETLIKFANGPIVIDADGLNFLAEHLDLLKSKTNDIIVTPHPKEMARLTNQTVNKIQAERIMFAKTFSKTYGIHTVLKGSGTIVTTPNGDVSINTTGNPGMATGGSGDILSGIISALLAQGFNAVNACTSGVFIHGLAGDIAANKLSQTSVLPTDIINSLPIVYKKIEEK